MRYSKEPYYYYLSLNNDNYYVRFSSRHDLIQKATELMNYLDGNDEWKKDKNFKDFCAEKHNDVVYLDGSYARLVVGATHPNINYTLEDDYESNRVIRACNHVGIDVQKSSCGEAFME